MKKTLLALIAFMFITCFLIPQLHAAKWKGEWFLRGQYQCVEITLDRRGRSLLATTPKAIVENDDGVDFLTVTRMLEKHSYKMHKRDSDIYILEPVSIGPNQSVARLREDDAFYGMYRKMIDCQLGAED